MVATVSANLGFGDYSIPHGKTFDQNQICSRVQKVFFSLIYGLLTTLSIVIIPVSLPLAIVGAATFSYLTIKTLLALVGTFYRSPPTGNLFPKEVETSVPALNQIAAQACSGFATQNGVESQEWKLNLIRAARHNIFISGCYCGGSDFDQTLDLIRERMRLVPHLTASILASNIFITAENKKRIDELKMEFKERFVCTITSEVFPYTSPNEEFSLSTNHTKAIVIDYGAAFMVGGSGIVTPWSKQKGEFTSEQIEPHGFLYDNFMGVKAYRDMDFVFQSPVNGIGTRVYMEMHKLLHRFSPISVPTQWPAQLEPLPIPHQIPNLKVAAYATGPELPTTAFIDDIVGAVNKAEKSIFIGHMYFHPPKNLLKALIDASNRGVQITLLTNKLGYRSPGGHIAYAELSRYHAKLLFEGRKKPNVEHFEYDIPYSTYHKKVIVIDGKTTFNGSANIGKKSLDCSDYEIDLRVESELFAAAAAQIVEQDKRLCQKDENPEISLKTRIYSTFLTVLTPFL